jgi:hypothetical protein
MSVSRGCIVAVVACAIVAIFGAGAATGARAGGTGGAICKALSASGLKVQWSVIGNVTCSKAKPWLVKILAVHGKPDAKVTSFKVAPKGFKCQATNNAKGRPSAGACYTGTIAYPTNGFQWFG